MRLYVHGFAGLLLCAPALAVADEVISDDLIVSGSLCAGSECIDGEDFGFDTLRLKSPTPQILFDDTSATGSFPNNDWMVGATDDGTATPSRFFIRNMTNSVNSLLISSEGDLALGAGAELVEGAISVGDLGNERRVTYVADATDDSDVVNLRQFEAFQTTALETVDTEVQALDERLEGLESRLSELMDRLEAVAAKVN